MKNKIKEEEGEPMKGLKKLYVSIAAGLLLLVLGGGSLCAFANTIPFQAVLKNDAGYYLQGRKDLHVKIYDENTQEMIWQETHHSVDFKAGAFVATLGINNELPDEVFLRPEGLSLGISVPSEISDARVKLAPMPFSVRAKYADKVTGKISATQIEGTVLATVTEKSVGAVELKEESITEEHLSEELLDKLPYDLEAVNGDLLLFKGGTWRRLPKGDEGTSLIIASDGYPKWDRANMSRNTIEDTIAEMFKAGSHTGISVSYDDEDNEIALQIEAEDLPKNTITEAGVVESGQGQVNKVWKTDATGIPGWRDDEGKSEEDIKGIVEETVAGKLRTEEEIEAIMQEAVKCSDGIVYTDGVLKIDENYLDKVIEDKLNKRKPDPEGNYPAGFCSISMKWKDAGHIVMQPGSVNLKGETHHITEEHELEILKFYDGIIGIYFDGEKFFHSENMPQWDYNFNGWYDGDNRCVGYVHIKDRDVVEFRLEGEHYIFTKPLLEANKKTDTCTIEDLFGDKLPDEVVTGDLIIFYFEDNMVARESVGDCYASLISRTTKKEEYIKIHETKVVERKYVDHRNFPLLHESAGREWKIEHQMHKETLMCYYWSPSKQRTE